MKKNNKGFSLVELIIVIAIMAILAGALAPALIKYINKSRRSTDIDNADTIKTAVTSALAEEDGYDSCNKTQYTSSELVAGGNAFTDATKSTLGSSVLKCKYGSNKNQVFTITVDKASNIVVVYGGTSATAANEIYPELGSNYK